MTLVADPVTAPPGLRAGNCHDYRRAPGELWPFDTDQLRAKGGKTGEERMDERTARAKQICDGCPLKTACLDFGIAQDHRYSSPEGIWGGNTPEERAAMQGLMIKWVSGNRRYAPLSEPGHSSKYRGVTFCPDRHDPMAPGRWQAQLKTFGRNNYIGKFDTEAKAARAYNAKALTLLGPTATLNEVPDEN